MIRYASVALIVALTHQTTLFAQSTTRLEREIQKSQPRAEPEDEARRKAINESARINRAPETIDELEEIEGVRLLRMPQGHYIIALDQYRPDHWSPRIRLRYDFSGAGFYQAPRGLRYSHRARTYGGQRVHSQSLGGFYDTPHYQPYDDAYGDAYIQGHVDAASEYQDYIASERAGRLLAANRLGVSAGLDHYRAGRYDRAAIEWIGAAEKNHADAASRVYAGHALFALGRYDEAVKYLSRAFELAPFLTESYYDVRAEYGNPDDFARHLATLKAYVASHPRSVPGVTLLGYVVAYTEGPGAAHPIFERARELSPNDFFVSRLLKISRAVTPMPGVVETEPGHAAEPANDDEARPSDGRRAKPPTALVRRVSYKPLGE